jgi:alpha-L-arabinofuranosidase
MDYQKSIADSLEQLPELQKKAKEMLSQVLTADQMKFCNDFEKGIKESTKDHNNIDFKAIQIHTDKYFKFMETLK